MAAKADRITTAIPGDGGAAPRDVLGIMVDGAASAEVGGLVLKPREDLFLDDETLSLHSRAAAYMTAGAPVHFRGPAGAGKTTLALHVAASLGRPVVMATGDSRMTSADLLGREIGVTASSTEDRYVQRVRKSETSTRADWVDGPLTEAMEKGWTLVYDEFTRAPAEANNALLSALEERVLILSSPVRRQRYVRAHPEFRAILTSNPEEYAGVSAAPDALLDRMVTFEIGWRGPVAERRVVARRTGLSEADAAVVVSLAAAAREDATDTFRAQGAASLRTALLIGGLTAALGARAHPADASFVQICLDVLEARAPRGLTEAERAAQRAALRGRIFAACRAAARVGEDAAPEPSPRAAGQADRAPLSETVA